VFSGVFIRWGFYACDRRHRDDFVFDGPTKKFTNLTMQAIGRDGRIIDNPLEDVSYVTTGDFTNEAITPLWDDVLIEIALGVVKGSGSVLTLAVSLHELLSDDRHAVSLWRSSLFLDFVWITTFGNTPQGRSPKLPR
jgi:hypothetical protein